MPVIGILVSALGAWIAVERVRESLTRKAVFWNCATVLLFAAALVAHMWLLFR